MSSLLTSQTSAYLLHRTWHHSAHKAAFTDHAIRAFAKFALRNSAKQRRWCLLTPSKQLCIQKYTGACVKRARYYTASTPPKTKFPGGDDTSVVTIEQWHCSTTKINFQFSQVQEKGSLKGYCDSVRLLNRMSAEIWMSRKQCLSATWDRWRLVLLLSD